MNDICNVSNIFFVIMYADDTSLVVNGKDLNALIQLLNTALIDLCTWFKANRLLLNTTKTFYMIFHRARIKHMSGVADSIVMDNTSARPEVRGTADVGWRSLNPLPINPPRTHSRLYHHMCLRTDGR